MKNKLNASLLFILLLSNLTYAQKPAPTLDQVSAKADSIRNQAKQQAPETTVEFTPTGNAKFDAEILAIEAKRIIYHKQHEINTYTFQYITSITIFIMVMLIVGLGMYLSYRQFTMNEKLATRKIKADKVTTESPTAEVFTSSHIELSKDGIKMDTAVIGLIILVISLAFFFLYLKVVYPVDIITDKVERPI